MAKIWNTTTAHHFITDLDDGDELFSESKNVLRKKLDETVDYLSANSTVVIVSQPPDLNGFGFKQVLRSNFDAIKRAIFDWHSGEYEILSKIRKDTGVNVIDSKKFFCSEEICRTRKDGRLLYMDDNHLSRLGADLLWRRITHSLSLTTND